MTDQPVRVAVVGTGAWWGRQHAVAFSSRQDAVLCAVAGRTPQRTRQRAGEFGVAGYTDIEEMLDRERPLVFELEQADALLAEAAERDLFFAINFNHRYARPMRLAEEAIREQRLGRLTFASWRFGGEPGTSSHPHANLIETQCHGLDLLEHLCGPVESVMAQMSDATSHGYATLTVALQFACGAVG